MIRYQLACDAGHAFESWFRDSAAYDDQAARGLLSCPVCGSGRVGKALMAPGVVTERAVPRPALTSEPSPSTHLPSPHPSAPALPQPGPPPVSLMSAEERAVRARLRAVREHLVQNSDDVGQRFADEARRMHEGTIEHRTIHGQATPDEARALMEDGIPVHPLPVLPDERN